MKYTSFYVAKKTTIPKAMGYEMGKKDKCGERLSMGERLYKKFDLPAEAISSSSVTITGRGEAVVCGCKRIAVFTSELIRLEMKEYDIVFEGAYLNCPSYGGGRIVLSGIFKSVSYEERGES